MMNRAEAKEREKEIITFIFENKISLIRHIEGLFFDSYSRARNYLAELEKKGLLKSTAFKHFGGEKVYFLSYKGIDYLKSLGLDAVRYKINENELLHDSGVIDLLVYFMKNKNVVNFTTDYRLRRIRKASNGNYRIPDFVFTDSKGLSGIVEYQLADKSMAVIKSYVEDYTSYYPADFIKYFIVKEGKQRRHSEVLNKMGRKDFIVATYSMEKGLITYQGQSPSQSGEMISSAI
jgi:DNA-binding PadR family transcriptional regulator